MLSTELNKNVSFSLIYLSFQMSFLERKKRQSSFACGDIFLYFRENL